MHRSMAVQFHHNLTVQSDSCQLVNQVMKCTGATAVPGCIPSVFVVNAMHAVRCKRELRYKTAALTSVELIFRQGSDHVYIYNSTRWHMHYQLNNRVPYGIMVLVSRSTDFYISGLTVCEIVFAEVIDHRSRVKMIHHRPAVYTCRLVMLS